MEDFLSDYVFMIAEANEYNNIDEKQLAQIVTNLANNDDLWNTFDGYVYEELKKIKNK